MNALMDRLHNILNDKQSGSITIGLKALNMLKEIPNSSEFDGSLAFKLIMTTRKEMSILVNLGAIGLNMVNKGYSLHHTCDLLINELNDSVRKSVTNAIKTVGEYKNFLTLSNSEQLRMFFSQLNKGVQVFIFNSGLQREGIRLATDISKKGVNVSFVNLTRLDETLNKVDCLVVGSDSIMRSLFSNRIGTLFLISYMISTCKPSYVLTVKWKLSRDRHLKYFDSKNFDLIPNKLITAFLSDIGSIKGEAIHKRLILKENYKLTEHFKKVPSKRNN